MFTGEYKHSIDDKGRLIIPSKIRQEIGKEIIITRGLDGCLFGYPKDTWKKRIEELNSLQYTKKDVRAFTRFFTSGAVTLDFDKQGRINIPNYLSDYASLGKDVVIIGVSDRIEIWSDKAWDEFLNNNIDRLSDIAENLFDANLGL
jgi:MraZ protein